MHSPGLLVGDGCAKEMVSDNGTDFVGAVKELKELVKQLDKN